ncbi:hypothetical protein RFM26_19090 [Mesorhizobium sp. VK23B]|uniref:GNAT family N-acetyltransferase n=1 Tax=Mesorhizobium dulcispinae TaxID=3072316 RepID=A0ABU4XK05_9HYPH|nr:MULTISPECIES: hypothetical protein [unclassified Mesorhizobium]MDX8467802.1 hypothetical protein [Mesorhizobium sp. VK23B]MDX8474140.1 hypothetical protein [Mesorhizobium sp. VK23A]
MSSFPEILLRPAASLDAAAIAQMMRASLNALDWMPLLHTPEEDLFFVRDIACPSSR